MYELEVKVKGRSKPVTIRSQLPIRFLTDDQLIANAKKSDSKITRDLHGNITQALCKCGLIFFPNQPCQCYGRVYRNWASKGNAKRRKYMKLGKGQRKLNLEQIKTGMGRIV